MTIKAKKQEIQINEDVFLLLVESKERRRREEKEKGERELGQGHYTPPHTTSRAASMSICEYYSSLIPHLFLTYSSVYVHNVHVQMCLCLNKHRYH